MSLLSYDLLKGIFVFENSWQDFKCSFNEVIVGC